MRYHIVELKLKAETQGQGEDEDDPVSCVRLSLSDLL